MLKKLCLILLALFLVVCTSPTVFSEEVVNYNIASLSNIETIVEEEPTNDGAAVAMEQQPAINSSDAAEISDIRIPLAKTEATWALVNLIAMVVTVTVSLILTILGWYNRWRRRHIQLSEDDNRKYQFWLRNKIIFRLVNSTLAIVSIVTFILTENIFLRLVFVDRFTPLMIALAILSIGAALFSKYVIKEYYSYFDAYKKKKN